MGMRELAVWLAFSGLTPIALAQPAAVRENWSPISPNAKAVTGPVTFMPTEISFQSGKSLSLIPHGHMLFRPAAKQKKVLVELYKVTSPDDAILLCSKGKPAAYLIVWKSEATGKRRRAAYVGAIHRPETQRWFAG